MLKAVVVAKKAIVAATCLENPAAGAEQALFVDASSVHVGAVLQQWKSECSTKFFQLTIGGLEESVSVD
jgi:hypothetical protein